VRIVAALQASGRVVAMTGDGSNDAAAIRLADVGIGIATHGSIAARNAADLVLTSPDMTLLLESVVEGRAMWQRVRDAVAILVGGNAGEVVFTLLGSAISGRAPLGTRQFLLVNLLTDMLPAMAVALTPAAAPQTTRSAQEALTTRTRAVEAGRALAAIPRPELGRDLLRGIALRGGATAAGAGTAWLLGRVSGRGRRASTMGLVALVGTQLGQTLLVGRRSPLVWVTVVGSGVALAVIVQTPGVSRFFGCVPLGPVAWTTVAVSSIGGTALSVVLPLVFRKLDLAGLTGTSRVTRMPSSTRPVETLLTSARTAVPRPSPR
jgi:cation-transporting ATPase I